MSLAYKVALAFSGDPLVAILMCLLPISVTLV